MKLSILDIYIGKRRRIEMGDIEDLAEDMRKTGQITAITVRPPNEEDRGQDDYRGEQWVLVAGGRRTAAAMRNGWLEIAAHDVRELDPIEHRVMELHENVKRKDMTWQEIAEAKHQLLALRREQNPEITQAEVAKEIGETAANFSRDIAVAEAMEARPGLKSAGSKKAVLRHAKTIEHFEARLKRESPSYATDLAQRIVTADMRDWLRKLPNGFADLTIPDLPYGIDHFSQGQKKVGAEHISEYDDAEGVSRDLFYDVIPQLMRVTKRSGWLCLFMSEANYSFIAGLMGETCITHFDYRSDAADGSCLLKPGDPEHRECEYRNVAEPRWIWYRPNSQNNPRFPETHAKNMYEHIIVYRMPEARLMRPCDNVLVYDAEYGNERIHAMQKPVELCVDLISRFTLPGETVIDPCFGSGNHLRAGAKLGRDIWGCDLNPNLRATALGNIAQDFNGVVPRAARSNGNGQQTAGEPEGESASVA